MPAPTASTQPGSTGTPSTPSGPKQTSLLGFFTKTPGSGGVVRTKSGSSSTPIAAGGSSSSLQRKPSASASASRPSFSKPISKEREAPKTHATYVDEPMSFDDLPPVSSGMNTMVGSSPLKEKSELKSRGVGGGGGKRSSISMMGKKGGKMDVDGNENESELSELEEENEDEIVAMEIDKPRIKSSNIMESGSKTESMVLQSEEPVDMDENQSYQPPSTRQSKRKRPSYIPTSTTFDSSSSETEANETVSQEKRKKRKAIVESSDEDGDGDGDGDEEFVPEVKQLGSKGKGNGKGKGKVELSDDDDDEYGDDMFDDLGDEDLTHLEDYEASLSLKPAPKPTKTKPFIPLQPSHPPKSTKTPTRPPPKPLVKTNSSFGGANNHSASGMGGGGGGSSRGGVGGSGMFMTRAELRKVDAKEKKEAGMDVFDFLKDVKDIDQNPPDHPMYDARTLYIPKSAWKDFTPFERQFWEIKQTHYDVVLFFQKGKFYELYENDADIGHNEFDLKLTGRVKMRMVGVPESSFDFWAAKFLAAGHKVGKVEQVETAIGKEMRTKNMSAANADKIVRRELASVLTNGTVVDTAFLSGDEAAHCLAIKESVGDDGMSSFGVCILDAPTGKFELAAFDDDACFTRLETLMRQLKPKEIIHAKGNLSVPALRLLRTVLPMNTSWVPLRPETEFLNADKTKAQLEGFFGSASSETGADSLGGIPHAIEAMLDKESAIEALGGMIFYLRSLNMDKDLLSQKSFDIYDPIRKGEHLVLDGQTLSHLEILMNNEGGMDGTLLQLLERCTTPFGKRLFRIWLTVPLLKVASIETRLDAVEDIMNHNDFSSSFNKLVQRIPDLERCISRIHAGKCKKAEFLKVMEAFRKLSGGLADLHGMAGEFERSSVAGLIESAPKIKPLLSHVQKMYKVADNDIEPTVGASEPCDEAVAEVDRIEGELEDLLPKLKRQIKCEKASWWHSNIGAKEVYHIEVPASCKVPGNWVKTSSTKALSRYMTPETKPLAREVQEARETKKMAYQVFYCELLAEFDKYREEWLKVVKVVAELDCLVSLAKASADLDEPKCRPTLVEADQAFVDFEELRHPAMCMRADQDFVSNDVQLGDKFARQTLLTGPNTAGKSTLCRQVAVACIMAQLGTFVAASRARISPLDRVCTRMGAYDAMFSSSSTFKVELDECSKILRDAGPKSLIILDELGRGTSTYDGMSVAESVMHHIATHTMPLGFFATHYGTLTDDFNYHPNVRLMHMQTQVDDEKREVICLYKLISGKAESSYGTHVAHISGVPESVVTRAEEVSKEFSVDFNEKLLTKRKSNLSVLAQADFAWLVKLAKSPSIIDSRGTLSSEMQVLRDCISRYDI